MLSNLDILRSFAILAVLFAHWALTLSGNGPDQHLVGGVDVYILGFTGVLIFFVHTSLVLMKSMERSGETGVRLFGAFYIRRFFRIYPLSTLLCLIVIAARIPPNVLGPGYSWPGRRRLLGNLTLTQNFLDDPRSLSDPMWSLPYEMQMYLFLPAIFLFLRGKQWELRFAVLLVLGVVAAHYWEPATYIPNFLCGVLAFGIMRRVKPRWPAWLWPLIILGAMWGYAALSRLRENNFFFNLALCLVLGASLPFFRELTNRHICIAAQNLAKYSYGIYLCHYPLMWFFYRKLSDLSPAGQHLGFLVSLILLPLLSYHFVEHPLIKVGTWLVTRRDLGSRCS